jgi:hypothetical protein
VATPLLVFLTCFGVGILATARWLPDLAAGPVGGMAFFTVCGLLAGALSLAGLHVFSAVYEIRNPALFPSLTKDDIAAGILRNILLDCGTLVGLAGIVYLLAPELDREASSIPPRALGATEGGSPTPET